MINQAMSPDPLSSGLNSEQCETIRGIMDSFSAVVVYKDREHRFLDCNLALSEWLGIPKKDILGRINEDLIPREQAEAIGAHEREVIESGQPKRDIVWSFEHKRLRNWVLIEMLPVFESKGTVSGVFSFSMNISALKNSLEALMVGYQQEKRLCREQKELIAQLQARMPEDPPGKTILRICSVCKKIHNGKDRHVSLESYLKDRFGVECTHGYCPECADKIFKEIQPQRGVCKECGVAMEVTRYEVEGRHFRRYSCPNCGYSQEYVRERRDD